MTSPTTNPQPDSGGPWGRLVTLFLSAVIGIAAIGYFVGLADGVPQPDGLWEERKAAHHAPPIEFKQIPAVSYSQIPTVAMGPTAAFREQAKSLPETAYDLMAEIKPSEADKAASSKIRASRRAYNGAPPIIPHAIQNTSDAACYACHSNGVQMAGLKASVMSHGFLANCTQCHAAPPPQPFQDVDAEVATSFVGLPAPTAGQRAYPGAPPTIPHSRWMRDKCTACHGGPNGWAGMESTHPWRTNCTQCHAPSAVLDQAIAADPIPMLSPITLSSP